MNQNSLQNLPLWPSVEITNSVALNCMLNRLNTKSLCVCVCILYLTLRSKNLLETVVAGPQVRSPVPVKGGKMILESCSQR